MLSRDSDKMPDFDAWSKTIQEMNTTSVSILKSIKDSSDTLDKLQLSITKSFRSLSKELTSSRTNFGKMLSGVGGSKTSAAGVASVGMSTAADFPEAKKTEEPKKTEDNKSSLGSVITDVALAGAGEVAKNKVEKSVAEKAAAGATEKVAETTATKAATGAGEKVAEKASADVVKKSVAKKVGGELLKLTGKALPFGVGAAIGGVFGAMRWWEGDKLGAAAEVALGAASAIPGAGTAISVAGNIALLGRDVYNEIYGTPENPRPLDSDAAEVIAKRMPDITSALTDEFKGAAKKNELSQKDTEAAIKSVGVKLGGGEGRGASTTDQRSAMEINKDLSNMYQQQVSSGKIKGAGEEGGISFDVWKKQQKSINEVNSPRQMQEPKPMTGEGDETAPEVTNNFSDDVDAAVKAKNERNKNNSVFKPVTKKSIDPNAVSNEPSPDAYASGKDYVPKTGPAIVGEEGPELVMSKDGSARVTGSGAHVEKLKKGDSVLPADETKEALPGVGEKVPSNKSGALPTGLTGYAKGTKATPKNDTGELILDSDWQPYLDKEKHARYMGGGSDTMSDDERNEYEGFKSKKQYGGKDSMWDEKVAHPNAEAAAQGYTADRGDAEEWDIQARLQRGERVDPDKPPGTMTKRELASRIQQYGMPALASGAYTPEEFQRITRAAGQFQWQTDAEDKYRAAKQAKNQPGEVKPLGAPTKMEGYAEGTDNATDEWKKLSKSEKQSLLHIDQKNKKEGGEKRSIEELLQLKSHPDYGSRVDQYEKKNAGDKNFGDFGSIDPKLIQESEGRINDYASALGEKDPEKRKAMMNAYYEQQKKAYEALSKAISEMGPSKPWSQEDADKAIESMKGKGAPEKAPDAGASGDAPSGGDAGGASAPAASADSGGAEAPSSGGDSGGDSGNSMGTPAGSATSTVPPAPPETPKPETSNQPVVINNEQTTNSDSSSGGEALSTPNFPMTAQNDMLTQYFQKQLLKEHN